MRYVFAALVLLLLGALVYQQHAAREEARHAEAVRALACEVKAAVEDAEEERESSEKLAQIDRLSAPLVAQGLLPATPARAVAAVDPVQAALDARCPELEALAGVPCVDALALCR